MAPAQTFRNILDPHAWSARQSAHETRARAWTDAHQARAARGEKHPVYDFLFEYYAFRPSWLRRWHPGIGVGLSGENAREFLRWPEYSESTVDTLSKESAPAMAAVVSTQSTESTAEIPTTTTPSAVRKRLAHESQTTTSRSSEAMVAVDPQRWSENRRATVNWLKTLLETMSTRPAFFGCFGLHEWAMVYQEKHDTIRHARWPLRFPPEEIARIVEAQPLTCTHYDAFRFFTPPARPRNRLALAREHVVQHEQRGCLHANMDLYKWAFKLAPYTASELVADTFALAYDIRAVDMRASPYDFSALGFTPIKIETPAGRAEYEAAQREFSKRGEPLRSQLLDVCNALLAAWAEPLQAMPV